MTAAEQESPHASEAFTVEVWADVVCPWCRLGKAYLERAIADFEHADDVTVVWRSFELDPNAPRRRPESLTEHLTAKLGRSADEVDQLHAMIQGRGEAVGVTFDFDAAQPGNTFDAHRLLQLGAAQDVQGAVADRLYEGYFAEGRAIGDPADLTELAVEAGLDEADVREVLATDRFAAEVRADEDEARALQVTGVPFFVFDRRVAASGAQPPEVLLAGLQQAWAARTS